MATTNARNRIKELRYVRAGDLQADARNWRKHPPVQRQAVQTMLNRVGWTDAVIARSTEGGLVLVDGHLRADLDPDAQIPVLVVDLDEAEAGEVIATLDPLAGMAEPDVDALNNLLTGMDSDPDMATLLTDVRDMYGLADEELGEQDTQAAYGELQGRVGRGGTMETPVVPIGTHKPLILQVPLDRYEELVSTLYEFAEEHEMTSFSDAVFKALEIANGASKPTS